MGDAGRAQQTRSEQLVVTGEERGGPVEDAHSLRFELRHAPDAFLDAVETLRNVEPVQSDIAAREPKERPSRREQMRPRANPPSSGEGDVRLRLLVGDDGELHLCSVRDGVEGVGEQGGATP